MLHSFSTNLLSIVSQPLRLHRVFPVSSVALCSIFKVIRSFLFFSFLSSYITNAHRIIHFSDCDFHLLFFSTTSPFIIFRSDPTVSWGLFFLTAIGTNSRQRYDCGSFLPTTTFSKQRAACFALALICRLTPQFWVIISISFEESSDMPISLISFTANQRLWEFQK